MFPSDMIFGVFFIFQICFGVLGNSLLCMAYLCTFLAQPHLRKPVDVICTHLTLVNILTTTFTLMPVIMSSFGARHFLEDVGCKVVLYVFRVTRGLSICTTSLLSAFQAIMISPTNSVWSWLKSKLSTLVFPSFLFFWIINMLIYIPVIQHVRAISNYTLIGRGFSHSYCQTRSFVDDKIGSHVSLLLFEELLFVFLILWTSLYMVSLLYRHHRRVQHVRSPGLSSQPPAEHIATRRILWLAGCFVFFYCSNNVVTYYSFYTPEKIPSLVQINEILSTCYPTICPILLMKNNKVRSVFTSSLSMLKITHTL